MSTVISTVKGIYNTVKELQPEIFLHTSSDVASRSLDTLKNLYDYTKVEETKSGFIHRITATPALITSSKSKKKRTIGLSLTEAPLVQLITEEFEPAQIWEEVQLQNGLMYESLVSSISKLLAHANSLQNQLDTEDLDHLNRASHRKSNLQHHQSYDYEDEEDSEEVEFEGNRNKKRREDTESKPKYSKSIVDDKFFNLAQMTEFLEKVESQLDNERNQEDPEEENSGSEDSIDLFEDNDYAEETGSGEGDKDENVFYSDFFDRPLDENETEPTQTGEKPGPVQSDDEADEEDGMDLDEDEEDDYLSDGKDAQHGANSPQKTVRFNLEPDEASTSEDEIENQAKDMPKPPDETILSTFEKKRKKIEENIKLMEEEALQPKGWQYQGEVTAERRPENSLLEEHLQFDHLLRQAPEITAKATLKLEDVIKQRIKDQAWDDVERKAKPIDTPVEYKNQLVLSSEKSKQSLAQLYEQDYINKKRGDDGQNIESVPEEEAKIQQDMRTLFAKLDALSNFHFTPKPPSADVKIVTNLPSIAMEEVAPVSVSDAALLAPQEIQAPVKGEIKAAAERSSTDKKRERRSKKKKQHLKRVDREEKARLKGLGLRNVKLADNILKKNKSKGKNSTGDEEVQNTKELKSSKAFFATLQDKVQTQIKDKLNKGSKKDSKKSPQAKRFKL